MSDEITEEFSDGCYALLHQGETDMVTVLDHGRLAVVINRDGQLALYLPLAATAPHEPDVAQVFELGRLDSCWRHPNWDAVPASWRDLAANLARILECRQGMRGEPPLHLVANPYNHLLAEAVALENALQKAGPKAERLLARASARRKRRWEMVRTWAGGRAYLPRSMEQ